MDEEPRPDEASAITVVLYEDGYVTRRRRTKRKGSTTGASSNKNEPQDNVVTSERKVFSENQEDCTKNDVICGTNLEDGVEVVSNNPIQSEAKISLDGQMKSPPEIEDQERLLKEAKDEVEFINENVNELVKVTLPKDSETYELENFKKHALLIFNQEYIENFSRRFGTDKDVEKLEETFSKLGFEVFVKHDLKKDEIMQALDEFSNKDFTDYGCVAVAVLTHGTSKGFIRAQDQQYSEENIINRFRRPTLAMKPKLLIIQACRGDEAIKGVPVLSPHKVETEKDLDEVVEPYTLPVESDMLIMHSSYIGKPSHRDKHRGSWFIQSVCRNIKKHAATTDLESILTVVKREVAVDYFNKEYNRRTHEVETNKQMPVTTSTLTRKLYLRKFGAKPVKSQPAVTSQVSIPMGSRNEMDSASSSTPKIDCFPCFPEYYEYMKKCLKMYVEDFPSDLAAASFYKIACAFEDNGPATATNDAFSRPKQETLEAIVLHLNNYRGPILCQALKYLHIYHKKL